MANERLRGALMGKSLNTVACAERLGVDPKTVERWIAKDRLPHRSHRQAVATLLNVDEGYLWPQVLDDPRTTSAGQAELVQFFPSRSSVPPSLWKSMLDGAKDAIDVLVYSGLFLPEQYDVNRLADRAQDGCRVRLLFGDPASAAVALRGREEGMGAGMAHRITLALRYIEPIVGVPGIEIRLHDTTLYASIFRSDDQLLANVHTWGSPAGQNPVMHLRRVPGGRVVDHYLTSVDRVWAGARPLTDVVEVLDEFQRENGAGNAARLR